MKVKEEAEKASLKLNSQKIKIMTSCRITAWQIDWGKNGNSDRLYFLRLQNHCECTHEIKRCLLLGRKAMTSPDNTVKSRNINLLTKVHIVKVMVFPVAMYRYESWTIKKTECQRIDAFQLWCWRRLLRVPWPAKRSNHSILEINPEYSLEVLIPKLKL